MIKFNCNKCDGKGRRMYTSTATYHAEKNPNIIGGAALTEDVCIDCGGKGWVRWKGLLGYFFPKDIYVSKSYKEKVNV